MNDFPKIIVTDKNTNVRDYLKRIFEKRALVVETAGRQSDLEAALLSEEYAEVLVLDPDLPGTDIDALLERLRSRVPPIKVLLHVCPSESVHFRDKKNSVVVEKDGDTKSLEKAVMLAVRHDRFARQKEPRPEHSLSSEKPDDR